jgi:hypothetical protein
VILTRELGNYPVQINTNSRQAEILTRELENYSVQVNTNSPQAEILTRELEAVRQLKALGTTAFRHRDCS